MQIAKVRVRISQFIYTDVMNMKVLSVVKPSYIYHGYSTWKTFCEEKFTPANIKNCGHLNVRKHRDINNGDQRITLDISLKFGNLDKMKITSSEPKYYLVISGKGLITSLGIKTIRRSKNLKRQGLPSLRSLLRIGI